MDFIRPSILRLSTPFSIISGIWSIIDISTADIENSSGISPFEALAFLAKWHIVKIILPTTRLGTSTTVGIPHTHMIGQGTTTRVGNTHCSREQRLQFQHPFAYESSASSSIETSRAKTTRVKPKSFQNSRVS